MLILIPSVTHAFSWPEQIGRLALRHGIDPNLATAIINCESSFDPNALNKNKNGSKDVGLMQINSTHWNFFKKKGLDVVNDPIDNLEAGFYLLETNGTRDYKASAHCWDKPLKAWQDDYLAVQ